MARYVVLHYAVLRTVVHRQPQVPPTKLVLVQHQTVGAKQPALPNQTAAPIQMSRPLRGSSTTSMALRTIARTAVRSSARTTCASIPISGRHYMELHNKDSESSPFLGKKTPISVFASLRRDTLNRCFLFLTRFFKTSLSWLFLCRQIQTGLSFVFLLISLEL